MEWAAAEEDGAVAWAAWVAERVLAAAMVAVAAARAVEMEVAAAVLVAAMEAAKAREAARMAVKTALQATRSTATLIATRQHCAAMRNKDPPRPAAPAPMSCRPCTGTRTCRLACGLSWLLKVPAHHSHGQAAKMLQLCARCCACAAPEEAEPQYHRRHHLQPQAPRRSPYFSAVVRSPRPASCALHPSASPGVALLRGGGRRHTERDKRREAVDNL